MKSFEFVFDTMDGFGNPVDFNQSVVVYAVDLDHAHELFNTYGDYDLQYSVTAIYELSI